MTIIFDWALDVVEIDGDIAIITIRKQGAQCIVDGFSFEVTDDAHIDGVPIEEVIAKTVECHVRAEQMDDD